MRCHTKEECVEWLSGRSRELPSQAHSAHSLTVWYPPNPAEIDFLWLARRISCREPVLLWITEWGIWPSSENWHLYDRLRVSHGEWRHLHEAPGNLFEICEMDDLATFLQVAATNGRGGYVLTTLDYVNFFFSHDEWIEFYVSAANDASLDEIRGQFSHLVEPPDPFHSGGRRRRISVEGEEVSPAQVHPPETQGT